MERPTESDYTSYVAYGRAMEEYCTHLEAQPKWQPIETAPKEGYVDLIVKLGPTEYDASIRLTNCFYRDGWWIAQPGTDDSHKLPEEWIATHWMPITPHPIV